MPPGARGKDELVYKILSVERTYYVCKAGATRCDFLPQISADDFAEEVDRIETSEAVSTYSAATFLPYIFAENGQLVQVKSQ